MKNIKQMWNEHPLIISWSLFALQIAPVVWDDISDYIAEKKIKRQAKEVVKEAETLLENIAK